MKICPIEYSYFFWILGFAIPHCIQRTDIGGRDVTSWMRWLLMKEGHTFHTSPEFEVVRQIKERMCYLSLNPDKEEQQEKESTASYQLPDGTVIDIGPTRFRAPELLFQPNLYGYEWAGIHEVLHTAIRKSDLDLRKNLYGNIILSGGSTLIRGFGDRLLQEVKVLAPKDNKVRIAAPQERLYSTWIGGSILASLETFRRMWISKKEYQAEGLRVVHRKTFWKTSCFVFSFFLTGKNPFFHALFHNLTFLRIPFNQSINQLTAFGILYTNLTFLTVCFLYFVEGICVIPVLLKILRSAEKSSWRKSETLFSMLCSIIWLFFESGFTNQSINWQLLASYTQTWLFLTVCFLYFMEGICVIPVLLKILRSVKKLSRRKSENPFFQCFVP